MVRVCCSAMAGGSFAPPTRSRCSCFGSRRAAQSGSRRFAARWRTGSARRASRRRVNIPLRWRRWPVIAVAVVAVLLVLGRVGAGIIADYLWYAAMGATALWRERTLLTLLVTVGSALVAATILFANLYVVRQSVVSLVLPRRVANIEIGEEVPGRYLV